MNRFCALLLAASILAAPASFARSPVEETRALVNPSIWPSPRWPYPVNSAHEQRIAALLGRMTLEEKVGQIIQADIASVTPEEVKRYHLGSVLNGGNSAPGGDEFAAPAKWLALADAFYAASVDTAGGRTGVPVIWGTDAVHGHSNIVGATLFPHNIGLGAARDPDLIERIAAVTAVEIRTTGQEWTFAPTVTVPRDFRWGRAYEGYSSDPALVASYAGRMIRGLQGKPGAGPILAGPHVIASTKHFIADGGTHEGRDQGDSKISETELRDVHGLPYGPAIEAGVETVMTSFSSWNGVKIAGHKGLLTDVLKGRMNFGGLIVTDWNAHGQVAGCTNASCPEALLAGIDMYMAPDTWRDLHRTLLAQVKDGTVPLARLDDAVARILRVKLRMGLFEAGPPSSRPLSGQFALLGSAAHREVARSAVRKSLVLLKNQGSVLPLRAGMNVLVAGDAADDIGRQSGGWTLTWQGTGVNNSHFPGATSIWTGIDAAVKAGGGRATLSPGGSFEARPDVAIVVFGETPYAEFQGDLKTLQLRPELRKPFETMRKLKAQGIPVVAVMVTGRPLFVNEALNLADAFVVAWLPGSEGGGVADVLTGAAGADFTGKLPTHWPATAKADGPQLHPFGYGLRMASSAVAWTPLSEDAGVAEAQTAGLLLDRGQPTAPLSLNVTDGKVDSTRLTTMPATAVGGRVRISATDHLVQEGALRFDVASGLANVEIVALEPFDLSRETNADVLLVVTLRRDGPVPATATLGVRSGAASAYVPFGRLAALPQGSWRRVGVPLKCFATAGASMGAVEVPFILSLPGRASVSLARVALGTDVDESLPCR